MVSYHPTVHWGPLWRPFICNYLSWWFSTRGMGIKREADFCVYLDTVTMKLYRLFQVSKALSFEITQTWNRWSNIVSPSPPKIGQPYVLPKLSKNSLCWLENRSRGNRPFTRAAEHCWSLFRWHSALLCKPFMEGTVVFSSYTCEIGGHSC